jgi:hypothetical protein
LRAVQTLTRTRDVGITNAGVALYDAKKRRIYFKRVNFRVQDGFLVKLTPVMYLPVITKFVDDQSELFEAVFQVAIEVQMQSNMEQFAQAFGAYIYGVYRSRGMIVRHVSPSATRAYFNSRITDMLVPTVVMKTNPTKRTIPRPMRYPLRKQLSIACLPRLISPADQVDFIRVFGTEHQADPIEAALLAIYAHEVDEPRRVAKGVRTLTDHIVEADFTCNFQHPRFIRLSEEERRAVLEPALAGKKRVAPSKSPGKKRASAPKKKRKTKAAPSSP